MRKNNLGVCELGLIAVGVPLQSVSTFLIAYIPEGFRPSAIKCASALATITGGAQNNQLAMQAYLYPNGDIKVVTPTVSGQYDVFLNASYLLQ